MGVLQGLEENMGYLIGDCLLAASYLSYMGPFLSNYRDELLGIWMKEVQQTGSTLYFSNIFYTNSPLNKCCLCSLLSFPVSLCSAQVLDSQIQCAPGFSFAVFLSKPTVVRNWNIQGLPSDAFSTENGVIITRGNRSGHIYEKRIID